MELLYGKPVAQNILSRLEEEISKCQKKPGLAVVLVGDDKASHLYVNLKEKAAKDIGMRFEKIIIKEDVSQDELLEKIEQLNFETDIHGIIVQLPLPKKFQTQKVIDAISPEKDVDGFHPENVALFEEGAGRFWPVFPQAILRVAESSQENLTDKFAMVIANSKKFGEVMRSALQQRGITGDYVLSKDMSKERDRILEADLVITAIGKAEALNRSFIKENAIIIDGGISEKQGKVVGDVASGELESYPGYLSPVPNGVGPVTIACLLENVYLAFKAQQKQN
jgi:methylenetetrahydrofolate dehydrogenase (NADP+)/methenyltetrahydrofolate cyclohydrolase